MFDAYFVKYFVKHFAKYFVKCFVKYFAKYFVQAGQSDKWSGTRKPAQTYSGTSHCELLHAVNLIDMFVKNVLSVFVERVLSNAFCR